MRGLISCSAHVRKALDRLRKVLDRFVRVAVLDAVTHAVLDVPLENDLAAAVQRGLGRIDLRKNILAGNVLVHHAVDGLHLTDDLFEPTVQIVGVHTLFHRLASIPVGVSALYTLRRDFINMRCRGGFVRLCRKNGVLRQFSLPPRCCRA